MSLLDRFSRKKLPIEPLADGLFLPKGCTRECDMLIIHPEYSKQWFIKYPDKREAVKQMLAFLKQQYPAVSNFQIRK